MAVSAGFPATANGDLTRDGKDVGVQRER